MGASRKHDDDRTPTDFHAALRSRQPANRRLAAVLMNHALDLQATLDQMRELIREVMANPDPVDHRESKRVEQWLRALATRHLSAAAEVDACRREHRR